MKQITKKLKTRRFREREIVIAYTMFDAAAPDAVAINPGAPRLSFQMVNGGLGVEDYLAVVASKAAAELSFEAIGSADEVLVESAGG